MRWQRYKSSTYKICPFKPLLESLSAFDQLSTNKTIIYAAETGGSVTILHAAKDLTYAASTYRITRKDELAL
jgi:hypothetical protein